MHRMSINGSIAFVMVTFGDRHINTLQNIQAKRSDRSGIIHSNWLNPLICEPIFMLNQTEYYSNIGLHMGPYNLCYVTRHFLLFSYVPKPLYIRP